MSRGALALILFLSGGIFASSGMFDAARVFFVCGLVIAVTAKDFAAGAPSGRNGSAKEAALIFLAAVLLRSVFLHTIPAGFAQDEAMNAVDARRIVEGTFENPFRSGNWSNPYLFHYLFALPMWAGLDTYFSLKLVAALAGSSAAAFVYLLGCELFGRSVGRAAGALAAISSWQLVNSRIAYLITFEPALAALSLLAIAKILRGNLSFGWAITGGVAIGVAAVMTRPVSIVLPLLFLLPVFPALRPLVFYRRYYLMALIAGCIFLPRLVVVLTENDQLARQREVFLLDATAWEDIKSREDRTPLRNWLDALQYWNVRGGSAERWNILPGRPALDAVTGALMLWGIVWLVRAAELKLLLFLTTFASLAFVPIVLALALDDQPSGYRLYLLTPLVFVAAGLGAARLLASARPHVTRGVAPALACFCLWQNLYGYFYEYPPSSERNLAVVQTELGRRVARYPDVPVFVSANMLRETPAFWTAANRVSPNDGITTVSEDFVPNTGQPAVVALMFTGGHPSARSAVAIDERLAPRCRRESVRSHGGKELGSLLICGEA